MPPQLDPLGRGGGARGTERLHLFGRTSQTQGTRASQYTQSHIQAEWGEIESRRRVAKSRTDVCAWADGHRKHIAGLRRQPRIAPTSGADLRGRGTAHRLRVPHAAPCHACPRPHDDLIALREKARSVESSESDWAAAVEPTGSARSQVMTKRTPLGLRWRVGEPSSDRRQARRRSAA